MTTRAQNLSQAIKEVGWDWETMEPSHPHTIAVATLRAVADRFATDWGELQYTRDILYEIATELEALK